MALLKGYSSQWDIHSINLHNMYTILVVPSNCASDVGGLRHWRLSLKMAAPWFQRGLFLVQLYYN